jgi:hypothetical protein
VLQRFGGYIAQYLGDGMPPPLRLSPQQERQRTQDALAAWLLAAAERQPILVVWGDPRLADPSTLELLAWSWSRRPRRGC